MSRIYVEDLPAPKREVDLPAPRAVAPGPTRAAPVAAAGAPQFGDLDLPAPKAPSASKTAAAGAFGDLDLPAPKKAQADLPALKDVADLPGPRGIADLPRARERRAELPAPRGIADLPAPRGVADLPGLAVGPTCRHRACRRPAHAKERGGPADAQRRRGPAVAQGRRRRLRRYRFTCTRVAERLRRTPRPGDAARGDESSFADHRPGVARPAAARAKRVRRGRVRRHPAAAAEGICGRLVPPKSKTVQGMGGVGARRSPPTSRASTTYSSTPNGADSVLPPSLTGDDDEASFSGLDPEDACRAAPAAPACCSNARARDRGPRRARARLRRTRAVMSLEEGDDFGEEDFAEGDDGRDAEDGDASDEDMEFGISGDEGVRGIAIPPEMLRQPARRRVRGQASRARAAHDHHRRARGDPFGAIDRRWRGAELHAVRRVRHLLLGALVAGGR